MLCTCYGVAISSRPCLYKVCTVVRVCVCECVCPLSMCVRVRLPHARWTLLLQSRGGCARASSMRLRDVGTGCTRRAVYTDACCWRACEIIASSSRRWRDRRRLWHHLNVCVCSFLYAVFCDHLDENMVHTRTQVTHSSEIYKTSTCLSGDGVVALSPVVIVDCDRLITRNYCIVA